MKIMLLKIYNKQNNNYLKMKKNFLRKIKTIKKGNHVKKVRKNNKTQ